ncbi:MAG: T9SS type A sorting domain-containing protein [Ignavibacteriae bacterium]|nr:T9SS type A sorting domain-containing protein [Ignavibacteriota bacterium]
MFKQIIRIILTFVLWTLTVCTQTSWQRVTSSSVLNPTSMMGVYGTFDDRYVVSPFVLAEDNVLKMWYTGYQTSGKYSIGQAVSWDGKHWYGLRENPVLPATSSDGIGKFVFSVVHDSNEYKMYYYQGVPYSYSVNLAISTDGYQWTEYSGNPILTRGESGDWDDEGVWAPYVLFENNSYKMWYQASDSTYSNIGYATSVDGKNWTKYTSNPVLEHGNVSDFDYYTVGEPSVVHHGSSFHLWYTSTSSSMVNAIGYATSLDGITWTKYGNGPVHSASPSSWDDTRVARASVMFKDSLFHMWYAGNTNVGTWRIGYATSGIDSPLTVKEPTSEQPGEFGLEINYPNPFNPTTLVQYHLPEQSFVTISIFDILGKEVDVLVEEIQDAGFKIKEWRASDYPSGTYFYRMEAVSVQNPSNKFIETKKLILMK